MRFIKKRVVLDRMNTATYIQDLLRGAWCPAVVVSITGDLAEAVTNAGYDVTPADSAFYYPVNNMYTVTTRVNGWEVIGAGFAGDIIMGIVRAYGDAHRRSKVAEKGN
jgi:hypothetical protein